MRVLLTGHKGYLGTVMAPVLAQAGHQVVGLDSGLFEDCVLGPAPEDPLGALAPQLTYDINHHASVRLARLARDAGVRRFLYASTCSVYGASGDGLVTEEAPL